MESNISDKSTLEEVFSKEVVEIFPTEGPLLKERLGGKRLRIKLGIDPTSKDLHLGHLVLMRKLRSFQDAGHTAVLVIGDFTARIGDPSGRNSSRPQLSKEDIDSNMDTYLKQLEKVLDTDPGRLEVHYNSSWLEELQLSDILHLLASKTANQLLGKEDFRVRYTAGNPIYLHEFLYPLLQGYDSYRVEADIEIGGTDQKFNIAVGREVQSLYNQRAQVGLLMPILKGTDGRKMSKSFNNYIGITESPIDIYGKLENLKDELVEEYFQLLTDYPLEELPIDNRERQGLLALEIVSSLYGGDIALKAQGIARRLSKKMELSNRVEDSSSQVLDVIPTFSISALQFPIKLFYLLKASGLSSTSSEGRREIAKGCVRLDEYGSSSLSIVDVDYVINEKKQLIGKLLRVGKKRVIRFIE